LHHEVEYKYHSYQIKICHLLFINMKIKSVRINLSKEMVP